MIPDRVMWKYNFSNEYSATSSNVVICVLERATEQKTYKSFNPTRKGEKFMTFIVHVFRDYMMNVDIIATILKNSESEYKDNEVINPGDYYGVYNIPLERDIFTYSFTMFDKNNDDKYIFFDNVLFFSLERFNMWCLPAGCIEYEDGPIQLTNFETLENNLNQSLAIDNESF